MISFAYLQHTPQGSKSLTNGIAQCTKGNMSWTSDIVHETTLLVVHENVQ